MLFSIIGLADLRAGHSHCPDVLQIVNQSQKIADEYFYEAPLTMGEFKNLVAALTKEKLLWFDLEDFVKQRTKNWNGLDTQNFLSYTFAIFVKSYSGDIVKVYLPLISFENTHSSKGFSWHMHIRQHLLENHPEIQNKYIYVDKGAVIIEKRGKMFYTENNNAYPHRENADGQRVVLGVNNRDLVMPTQQ